MLYAFLKYRIISVLDINKSKTDAIKKQIENGQILLNYKIVKSGEKLRENDIVIIYQIEPKELGVSPENLPIDIIYEDNDLAVINKPKGMVVHPANGNEDGTLVNALLYHLDNHHVYHNKL